VLGEEGKDQPDGLRDLLVRVEDHPASGIVDESHGQAKAELAQFGFGQLAAPEALPQPVQFRLTPRAFEAQEQAIILLAGIVEAFLVHDQRVGQRTDLPQVIPVAARAGEARRFQTEHGTSVLAPHFGDKPLKAITGSGRRTGLALVLINNANPFSGPAEGQRPGHQVILPGGAAGVGTHLEQGELADGDEGLPVEVIRPNFVVGET
jgi:hypothetical protein